jgi:hypothetical protein
LKVIVFSTKKALIGRLKPLEKTRLFNYHTADPKDLKKTLAEAKAETLIYLDASEFTEAQITRTMKASAENGAIRIGVIDSGGVIGDPGSLFHLGAADYLSKKIIQQGVTGPRLQKAISFSDFEQPPKKGTSKTAPDSTWKLSGPSWKNVKSGQEYTFCFMFVEIDLIDEWKNKSGRAHLDEVKAAFQKHVQQFASALSGKIWMWMDLGGLILFPFDGKRCDPILDGIRLVLNRLVISAEEYAYHTTISYRLALHIGNTLYRSRGNTGTIVSATVNFLFHLGQKFAKPGNFYLTEPVARFIPEKFEECFVSAGTFEDIPISRMRLPVSGVRR